MKTTKKGIEAREVYGTHKGSFPQRWRARIEEKTIIVGIPFFTTRREKRYRWVLWHKWVGWSESLYKSVWFKSKKACILSANKVLDTIAEKEEWVKK